MKFVSPEPSLRQKFLVEKVKGGYSIVLKVDLDEKKLNEAIKEWLKKMGAENE